MTEERDRLSMAAAAELVGRTSETIRAWINDGTVQAEKVNGRWFVDPESLFAAAGMPYMRIIYDLTKRTTSLERLVRTLQRDLREMKERERAHEREIARLNAMFVNDDFTTKAGIARFFVRHGMSYDTLLHLAHRDPRFPVSQSPDVIIAHVRQLAAQSQQAQQQHKRGRALKTPHQCDIPGCPCHTVVPPLPLA